MQPRKQFDDGVLRIHPNLHTRGIVLELLLHILDIGDEGARVHLTHALERREADQAREDPLQDVLERGVLGNPRGVPQLDHAICEPGVEVNAKGQLVERNREGDVLAEPMFFLTFILTFGYFLANFERLVLSCNQYRSRFLQVNTKYSFGGS